MCLCCRQMDSTQNETRKRMAKENIDYETKLKSFVNGSFKEFDYNLEQFKKEYDSVSLGTPDIKTVSLAGNTSADKANEEVSCIFSGLILFDV